MNALPTPPGLPLRAMVMVLLFLGVDAFCWSDFRPWARAMNPVPNESPMATVTTTPTPSPSVCRRPRQPPRPMVQVYNISETERVAETPRLSCRDAGWNVTETGDLTLGTV